jgi:hypothetical protein
MRVSGLRNRFKGTLYPSPSVWWNWTKIDYGVRIGLPHTTDITVERAHHNIVAPRPLNLDETLVTFRIRI